MMYKPNQLAPSDPNLYSLLESEFPLPWQMTRWEKHTFHSLVSLRRPEVAIEIGNAYGGSLQVLSKYCKKVYAIDFQESVHENLRKVCGANIEYCTGDSQIVLPQVLQKIKQSGESLEFVFIDGNHSESGVRADINHLLDHVHPLNELIVVMHDSYNPVCRKGILSGKWRECSKVHWLDIDFIPGNYYETKLDACDTKSMWNGFALAVLKPELRIDELEIRQSLRPTYNLLFQHSRYKNMQKRYLMRIKGMLKRVLKTSK